MSLDGSNRFGAIALLGSGEYLDVMNETDRWLIETIGGKEAAHVALIPTASGLEPGMPDHWNGMGVEHFASLAARVSPLALISRDDTYNEEVLNVLRQANLFYFSGGNPQYLIECFQDSPAWAIIQSRFREGAAIAGCSAGAIMLADYRINVRAIMAGEPPSWQRSMGVVPGLAVSPHFDRATRRLGPEAVHEILQKLVQEAPTDVVAVGIDEDTALVRSPATMGSHWQVMGRQTVSVFTQDGPPSIYSAGETLTLDLPMQTPQDSSV